jgi:hypothetical protein
MPEQQDIPRRCLLCGMRHLGSIAILFASVLNAQGWLQLADFPGSARDDAAAFTINDRIYVGTGMDIGYQLRNDWYVYDGSAGTWETIAPLPASPRQYCATFSLGFRGFLFGGIDSIGGLNELWAYDPSADAWEQRASLPAPGRWACVAFTDAGYGYICTGMLDGGTATSEVWRYDQVADEWTAVAPVPGTARHRAAGHGFLETIIAGGADGQFNALSDVYAYQSWEDEWNELAALPEPRFGADAAHGFLVGGASSLSELHDDVWYHGWSDSWTTIPQPAFEGGPRRGGVIGSYILGVDAPLSLFYGTGYDGNERKQDWWRLDIGGAVAELPMGVRPVLVSNLVSNVIEVRMPNGTGPTSASVYDVEGRSFVMQARVEQNTTIDVSMLADGMYFLTFSGSISAVSLRFVVMH